MVFYGAVMVPGMLAIPPYYGARAYAMGRAKKAVAASSVKVKGRDVVATYKIMAWMVMG